MLLKCVPHVQHDCFSSFKQSDHCFLVSSLPLPPSLRKLSIERLQKHSTKSMSLGSPNNGSNCEGKMLGYKKNKLCLISVLYIKNINEECFLGYKAHARDVLSMF